MPGPARQYADKASEKGREQYIKLANVVAATAVEPDPQRQSSPHAREVWTPKSERFRHRDSVSIAKGQYLRSLEVEVWLAPRGSYVAASRPLPSA